MDYFKLEFGHPNSTDTTNAYNGYLYHTWEKSLITSILSAGTFFGALFAGSVSDWIGRRDTVIAGCGVFTVGVIMQVASTEVGLLVAGRIIAGLGVGFVSATIIMYMSEIAPKGVRGGEFTKTCNWPLANSTSNRLWLPIRRHNRPVARLLRRPGHPQANGLWELPYSNRPTIPLGVDSGRRSCSASRVASLLRQERQGRKGR